jgi:hypothetical protein
LNVDTTTFEILKREAAIGYTLSPGASIRCKEPIIAKVSGHCGDGYTIQLYPTIKVDASTTIKTASAYAHKLVLEVVEFSILRGILDSVMTLYPDKKYIVDGYFAMDETAELHIKPGVNILFSNGAGLALNKGKLYAKGTPDSLITFTMRLGHERFIHYIKGDSAVGAIEYTVFDRLAYGRGYITNTFQNLILKNCIIQNNASDYGETILTNCILEFCNLINNSAKFKGCLGSFMNNVQLHSCNVMYNEFELSPSYVHDATVWGNTNTPHACNIFNNYNLDGEQMNADVNPQNGLV